MYRMKSKSRSSKDGRLYQGVTRRPVLDEETFIQPDNDTDGPSSATRPRTLNAIDPGNWTASCSESSDPRSSPESGLENEIELRDLLSQRKDIDDVHLSMIALFALEKGMCWEPVQNSTQAQQPVSPPADPSDATADVTEEILAIFTKLVQTFHILWKYQMLHLYPESFSCESRGDYNQTPEHPSIYLISPPIALQAVNFLLINAVEIHQHCQLFPKLLIFTVETIVVGIRMLHLFRTNLPNFPDDSIHTLARNCRVLRQLVKTSLPPPHSIDRPSVELQLSFIDKSILLLRDRNSGTFGSRPYSVSDLQALRPHEPLYPSEHLTTRLEELLDELATSDETWMDKAFSQYCEFLDLMNLVLSACAQAGLRERRKRLKMGELYEEPKEEGYLPWARDLVENVNQVLDIRIDEPASNSSLRVLLAPSTKILKRCLGFDFRDSQPSIIPNETFYGELCSQLRRKNNVAAICNLAGEKLSSDIEEAITNPGSDPQSQDDSRYLQCFMAACEDNHMSIMTSGDKSDGTASCSKCPKPITHWEKITPIEDISKRINRYKRKKLALVKGYTSLHFKNHFSIPSPRRLLSSANQSGLGLGITDFGPHDDEELYAPGDLPITTRGDSDLPGEYTTTPPTERRKTYPAPSALLATNTRDSYGSSGHRNSGQSLSQSFINQTPASDGEGSPNLTNIKSHGKGKFMGIFPRSGKSSSASSVDSHKRSAKDKADPLAKLQAINSKDKHGLTLLGGLLSFDSKLAIFWTKHAVGVYSIMDHQHHDGPSNDTRSKHSLTLEELHVPTPSTDEIERLAVSDTTIARVINCGDVRKIVFTLLDGSDVACNKIEGSSLYVKLGASKDQPFLAAVAYLQPYGEGTCDAINFYDSADKVKDDKAEVSFLKPREEGNNRVVKSTLQALDFARGENHLLLVSEDVVKPRIGGVHEERNELRVWSRVMGTNGSFATKLWANFEIKPTPYEYQGVTSVTYSNAHKLICIAFWSGDAETGNPRLLYNHRVNKEEKYIFSSNIFCNKIQKALFSDKGNMLILLDAYGILVRVKFGKSAGTGNWPAMAITKYCGVEKFQQADRVEKISIDMKISKDEKTLFLLWLQSGKPVLKAIDLTTDFK